MQQYLLTKEYKILERRNGGSRTACCDSIHGSFHRATRRK